jgi:alkylation response protein AidB-like acyl-CoA dehydrogenase
MVAIIEHPDVKRTLMTMKALTAAARAICFSTARAIDLSHLAGDEAERQANKALADLLTPVAKAFSTDVGVEVASLGVQIHGGMGFIEETGAAQHFRDARIAPIYEGTNGIQAIDLVTRKVPMEGGAVVERFVSALRDDVGRVMASNDPGFGQAGYRLSAAIDALEEATGWLQRELGGDQDRALGGATPYLRLFGLTAGGVAVARGALAATKAGDGSAPARVNLARFLAENLATEAPALAATVTGGAGALADMPAEQLAL